MEMDQLPGKVPSPWSKVIVVGKHLLILSGRSIHTSIIFWDCGASYQRKRLQHASLDVNILPKWPDACLFARTAVFPSALNPFPSVMLSGSFHPDV